KYGNYGPFEYCNFTGELRLPSNIKTIPEGCFKTCKFSSITNFTEELLEIGKSAFAYCSRLSGVLEFPKSLISIGDSAFAGCSTLEGIVLPEELGVIKTNTFQNCYYINKITCKAIEPPTILSGAFDGVAKDNFTVEVPEQSVNRYQNDTNWGEFKRIESHQDFSISRRLMRTLNAEHSRKFALRAPANQAWSIESIPEWVTVTPSSGIGKAEVVVTVSEMTDADISTFEINMGAYNSPNYETHNGRAGEIVFLLNDKDYRTTMSVEQYDCDNYDGEVIVNQTASEGKGVNVVFMGDCFDARDIAMGSYLDGINEAIDYYFDIEPYKTYKPYFNIYTMVGMSNDSGMGTVNTIRDAKFGSQYTLNEGVDLDGGLCFEYAMKASTVNENNLCQTLVILIENTTEYGGLTYMWGDGSAIAICPMSRDSYPYDFRGLVQHEAGGHGFAKLADEYIYFNSWMRTCPCYGAFLSGKALGWYRNLEDLGDMDKVGWSHLIFHPKYSNIVDIYEGGYTHTRGCFRSEPNSCMNNNIPYYSAISRQEMVERIMKYAGKEFDINEFYANDVLDSQGNITGGSRSVVENAITLTGAGKQLPPKFMGDKPQLR
ncbi:MAG: leucine-rich repeat protein, partial [Alistipes sp.]|nr:leucine-rich repeat protein [Alistipes sp.]